MTFVTPVDFGDPLSGIDLPISFYFFQYGESLTARSYIKKSRKVTSDESRADFSNLNKELFLKDRIHNLNGWY